MEGLLILKKFRGFEKRYGAESRLEKSFKFSGSFNQNVRDNTSKCSIKSKL